MLRGTCFRLLVDRGNMCFWVGTGLSEVCKAEKYRAISVAEKQVTEFSLAYFGSI
jgi:hypothetical protein